LGSEEHGMIYFEIDHRLCGSYDCCMKRPRAKKQKQRVNGGEEGVFPKRGGGCGLRVVWSETRCTLRCDIALEHKTALNWV